MIGHKSMIGLAALAAMAATPIAESEPPLPGLEPERDPEPQATPPIDSDEIPDRVCLEEGSPHYFSKWREIGVRFNGGERNIVVEFCLSEGWMRTQIFHGGRPKMERGKFITMKLHGHVEAYWRKRP